ncbi:MAG: site-specific DNA-methyltransferase [Bacilli bacterium]
MDNKYTFSTDKTHLTIYNDDCLMVLKDIKDNTIDLVVTDPPYRIVSGGGTIIPRKDEPKGIFNRRDIRTKDNAKNGKLFDFNSIKFSDWLPDVYRVLKPKAHCYIMINARNLKDLQVDCEKVGFIFQNILVWKKNNATPNRYYLNNCEFILMLRKENAKNINEMGTKNVLEFNNILGNKLHPTQKPIDLLEVLIKNSSNIGDIILDPFAGSGATLLASKRLSRNAIGIELDKTYFDVAKEYIKNE